MPRFDSVLPPLVGRTEEIGTIATWLRRGERLLALWGPPGIGKTRLATEIARRSEELAAGPAWVCSVAEAGDVDRLCATMAAQLDAPFAGAMSTHQSLL